jgi:hypothetical protein
MGLLGSMLGSAVGTPGLCGIWALEAMNYLVHVVLRPTPWNRVSTVAGYSLWALQLMCLARFQMVDPGRPSQNWIADAQEGLQPATVCERSGELLPPRAAYVRSAGGVVLGLDHMCFWLGRPVGLRNRKFFVLFICYSACFCTMGAMHSLYALVCALPEHLPAPDQAPLAAVDGSGWMASQCRYVGGLPPSLHGAIAERRIGAAVLETFSALHGWFAAVLHMLERASAAGHMWYTLLLIATVPANAIAACVLGWFSIDHCSLVARNRTSVQPEDSRYDVGFGANVRQVFGASMVLWPLPTLSDSLGDGYESFPLNPNGGRLLDTGRWRRNRKKRS